jgi:hypothetical protein
MGPSPHRSSVSTVSTLQDFFEEVPDGDLSLVTVNRTQPDPVQELVAEAFDTQSVDLAERRLPDEADDLLVLREGETVRAVSSLDDVMQSMLLVNSDRFRTSLRGFDEEVPDVLTGMHDCLFDLRGFPASNKEKLLLVVISRHIESRAYRAGAGVHRATFQHLSRLRDELGTRKVYDRLADCDDLSVHVYGVPDSVPDSLDATVHGGTEEEYRRSWCVTFRAAPSADAGSAALVALQTDANRWRGFWTYDDERVRRIDAYLDRSL